MQSNYKYGTLADGVPVVVSIATNTLPIVVTLASAAGARKLRIRTLTEYFQPPYDVDGTTATQLVLTIGASVADLEITGQAGDTWSVR